MRKRLIADRWTEFHESLPVPFPKDPRQPVHLETTSLRVDVTTVEHHWCRWRSMYVHDHEGNILELVCYDEEIT